MLKYVIGIQQRTGYFLPVVFGAEVTHSHIAPALVEAGATLHSAGFCMVKRGRVYMSPMSSESLNLGPQPEDEAVLTLFLINGLAGLQLANALLAVELGVDPQ